MIPGVTELLLIAGAVLILFGTGRGAWAMRLIQQKFGDAATEKLQEALGLDDPPRDEDDPPAS